MPKKGSKIEEKKKCDAIYLHEGKLGILAHGEHNTDRNQASTSCSLVVSTNTVVNVIFTTHLNCKKN